MVKTYTDTRSLPPACMRLLEDAGKENFFLGPAWFETFTDTMLEKGAQTRIYTVEDPGGRVDLLLMARTPAGQNGSMLRCGHLSRNTLAGLTNYQTNIFSPIVSRDVASAQRAFQELGGYLASERPRWEVLDFNYLDASTSSYTHFLYGLSGKGFVVEPYFHCRSWYERAEQRTWSEYLRDRSPSAHKAIQNYARKGRKLEKTGKVRYEIFRHPHELDSALEDYQRVYAASWKEPEPFPQFVPRLFRSAAAAGVLRLGVLYLNDEPLATEVAFVSNGRATMVKTAYDQKYRDLSVGSLIIMHVMKHLLEEERVREIEFGPFDAPYKALWVSQTRDFHGVVAFNTRAPRGLYAMAHQHAWRAARALRARLAPAAAQPDATAKH